jgi:hypothetical protein
MEMFQIMELLKSDPTAFKWRLSSKECRRFHSEQPDLKHLKSNQLIIPFTQSVAKQAVVLRDIG